MARDYLAAIFKKSGDKVDYGIKGMKWGVRRTDSQIAASKKSGGSSSAKKTEAKSESSSGGAETSAARYARLQAVAKSGGASSLPDSDLKFFNARTEALAKVNRMNETKPGWLADTSKRVIQQTAQNQMQNIATGLADKYISGPVLAGLKDNSAAIKAESKTPIDYIGKHRAKKK